MTTESTQKTIEGSILLFNLEPPVQDLFKGDFAKTGILVFEQTDQQDAVKLIKQEKIDIILADYSSSSFGGEKVTNFLMILKKDHPDVNRIILSEVSNQKKVMNLVLKGIVSNYFERPAGLETLSKTVIKLIESKSLLNKPKLLKLINTIGELPAFPKTYQNFMEAIENDRSNREIAHILEKDISISTKVLQIANSAFHRTGKIASIERACIYMGLETIKNIVVTIALSTIRKLDRLQNLHLERIIAHSLKVNSHFQRFYRLETKKSVPERFLSIGLTHDIGKIIMLQYLPERFMKIIKYQKKHPDISFYRSEIEIGFDSSSHAEMGAYFLDRWNLPEMNVLTALYHHSPDEAPESYTEIFDIFLSKTSFPSRSDPGKMLVKKQY